MAVAIGGSHSGPARKGGGGASWCVWLLLSVLMVGVQAQSVLDAALRTARPMPSGDRVDILFVIDRSPSMDRLDPERFRVEGVRKILYTLDEKDRVGFLFFSQQIDTRHPLTPVLESNRSELLSLANVSVADQEPATKNLGAVLISALNTMAGRKDPSARGHVFLVTSAKIGPDEDTAALTKLFGRIARNYRRANVELDVIALGTEATKAHALMSEIQTVPARKRAKTGAELPAAFSSLLMRIQGYSPRVRKFRVEAGKPLEGTLPVPPMAEWLELDLTTDPDAAGVVPLQVKLFDPDGTQIRATYFSPGTVLYRLPNPKVGIWRYEMVTPRATKAARRFIVDRGLKVMTSFPQVTFVRKNITLYFELVIPEGKLPGTAFDVAGTSYKLVRGRVTVTTPSGAEEEILAKLEETRRTPARLEYHISWRPSEVGEHTIRAQIYTRHEEDYFVLERTTTIRVTDDVNDLPLVGLTRPVGGAPIPLEGDKDKGPRKLQIVAAVLNPGMANAAPRMLGRYLVAQVERAASVRTSTTGGITNFELAGNAEPLGNDGQVFLLPDDTDPREVVYSFPNGPGAIYLDRAGYYHVRLVDGPTYRLSPAQREVYLKVGHEPLNVSAIALIVLGILIAFVGGLLYLLVEWGKIDLTPPPPPTKPEDVLIEEETFAFVDVLTEDAYAVPLVIPDEIASFENGLLMNHVYLAHESILGGNYIATVRRGEARLNGAPIGGEFELHMGLEDVFSIGPLVTEITGIETPVLVIQFQVRECKNARVVNAATERETARWTVTADQDKRVPPQPGETRALDFSNREEALIARDEGFTADMPYDLALYHDSVGLPHARLVKHEYLNQSIGYGIEAVRGSLYVNDVRLEPGQSLDEFPSGSTITIGQFKFTFSWDDDPLAPVLEFVDAPAPEPLPLPGLMEGLTGADFEDTGVTSDTDSELASLFEEGAAPTEEGAETSLEDLMGEGGGPAEPSGEESLEALFGEGAETGAAETPEGEMSLDDLAALMGEADLEPELEEETEATETDDVSELLAEVSEEAAAEVADETAVEGPPETEEPSLESLFDEAPATDEETSEEEETTVEETGEEEEAPAPEEEPGVEELADEVSGEAPSLDALFGGEREETPPPEEAPPSETPSEDFDVATGLPTPAHFEEQLEDDWQTASDSDLDLSIILIDAERAIQEGDDRLIAEMTRLLQDEFGEVGFLARADVALFSLLLPNVPLDEAIEVAGLVRNTLSSALPASADQITVGVAERRASGADDPGRFLEALQDAMEQGAEGGQNFIVYG